jgi:hypothetical protein
VVRDEIGRSRSRCGSYLLKRLLPQDAKIKPCVPALGKKTERKSTIASTGNSARRNLAVRRLIDKSG